MIIFVPMTNRLFDLASSEDSDRLKCKLLGVCEHFEAHPSRTSRPPDSEQ